jgi:hypothetical protein
MSGRPATAFRLKAEATRTILFRRTILATRTFLATLATPAVWILALLALTPVTALAQMPDARQMSGIPRPDPQLATGTVTVRVARGSFANPVDSLTVELSIGGAARQATTNGEGRAEFTGIAPGTSLKASTVVAGEKLESQEFSMPASGGVRLALIAVDPAGGASGPSGVPAAPAEPVVPAQPGNVVLGEDSRFVFEAGDDGLSVFYVLQIRNDATAPVKPEKPVVFELPEAAKGAGLLEGSSPQAKVVGRKLEIAGPFRAGETNDQEGYPIPFGNDNDTIDQPLPVPLSHLAVVAEKIGDMQLSSPQMPEQQTMPANGKLYIAGRGPALQANQTLTFAFSNMPHYSTWPRDLALAVAVLILAGGAYSAFRGGSRRAAEQDRRRELEVRRDQLFDELTALEGERRQGASDPAQYGVRRRELVTALERIYAALDDEVAVPRAS